MGKSKKEVNERSLYPSGNSFFAWRLAAQSQKSIPSQDEVFGQTKKGPRKHPQEIYSEETQSFKVRKSVDQQAQAQKAQNDNDDEQNSDCCCCCPF